MPGGAPGLQNQSLGGVPVHGEFDSHTLPPVIARPPRFRRLFVLPKKNGVANIFANISF